MDKENLSGEKALIEERRKKLEQLRDKGDAYGNSFKPKNNASKLHEEYGVFSKEDLEKKDIKNISVAGRIVLKRVMGNASFATLRDSSGDIQIYVTKNNVDESVYEDFKTWDLGDIVGVSGSLFRTKTDELTIDVWDLEMITKSLRPMPEKFKGLTDIEARYRQRYLDLMTNNETKEVFVKRTKIIDSMRKKMNECGYLEVETPILQPIYGGAAARPFKTHHKTLDMPLYLRIANELYLKRLIVGGFDGVYEFAKAFRNEGMDRTHNPEFTMLEIYVAYKDYNWMMDFTEQMMERVATDVNDTTEVTFGENKISFKAPFARVTMTDAIKDHTGIDISGMDEAQLRDACKSLNIDVDDTMGKGKLIDEIFGEKCEPHYIQPTFITDYPVEMSPLCKAHRDDPNLTERFELMINGKEIANAYSELNDPIDQRARFEEQMALSAKGDDEAMFIDQDFLRSLEYGMPPTSGMGIGIDRFTMLLTNQTSIQEVLFFPQMRPEKFDSKASLDLKDHEKVIFDILSEEKSMDVNALKSLSGLSNKKWDKGLKALSKLGLTKVTKTEAGIVIDLVE